MSAAVAVCDIANPAPLRPARCVYSMKLENGIRKKLAFANAACGADFGPEEKADPILSCVRLHRFCFNEGFALNIFEFGSERANFANEATHSAGPPKGDILLSGAVVSDGGANAPKESAATITTAEKTTEQRAACTQPLMG